MFFHDGRVAFLATADSREVPDRSAAAATAKSALFDTASGFWGTYMVEDDGRVVRYQVMGALNPNMVGGDVVRTISWEGDLLVLRHPAARGGTGESVWRRVQRVR